MAQKRGADICFGDAAEMRSYRPAGRSRGQRTSSAYIFSAICNSNRPAEWPLINLLVRSGSKLSKLTLEIQAIWGSSLVLVTLPLAAFIAALALGPGCCSAIIPSP
jgi:hypothetical protein